MDQVGRKLLINLIKMQKLGMMNNLIVQGRALAATTHPQGSQSLEMEI